MADSTITLANTINWTKPFVYYRSIVDSNNEPALSTANLVKQTILGAPFSWKWNRKATSFSISNATTDTSVAISDFGFLEDASVTAAGVTYRIKDIRNFLPSASTPTGRPQQLSPLITDGAGNVTFRSLPVANTGYTCNIVYQAKAGLFTATSQTWSPIPDEYAFVFQHGFLAFTFLYADDPRWQVELPRFLASLVGISEGLSEKQKSVFLDTWLNSALVSQRKSGLAGQGTQASAAPTIGDR